MKKILLTLFSILILVGGIAAGKAIAQANPPLRVGLVLDKSTYNSAEKIQAIVSLGNYSGADKITPLGFMALPFHLYLVLTDPDGKVITSNQLRDKPLTDPPPPLPLDGIVPGVRVQVEPVETVPSAWRWSYTIPNLHDYYTFTKPGKYSVKAMIPLRTYPNIDYPKNPDADPPVLYDYSRLDRSNWDGHIESTPASSFTLLASSTASGTINVKAEKFTLSLGRFPHFTIGPINGMPVRVYDVSDECIARFKKSKWGLSWYNYESIWNNCAHVESFGLTDQNNTGRISFTLPPGDYLIIGLYDPDKTKTGDERYVGVMADDLDPRETLNRYLWVFAMADGKEVPCKYTTMIGTELQIIEPEYVEWDGTQELYPFVYKTEGDWTVTTSVSPPEGFVSDAKALTAEVVSEVKAVQFTLTDVGSKWKHTKVKHRIKHKGKVKDIESEVGVRLSKRLAKQKGKSIFGDEDK
jgi:hypothetical protein